jgi:hypothetical protein
MTVIVLLPLIFLVGLLLCTVPLVAFVDPNDHSATSRVGGGGGLPPGTLPTVSNLDYATRQKLYLLFVLPAVVSVNAIVVYFVFYRHLRNVYYRIEVSQVSNVALSLTTRGMQHRGIRVFDLGPGGVDAVCSSADTNFLQSNRSMVLVAPPTDDQKIRHHARRSNVAVASCPKPSLSDVAALLTSIDAVLDEGDRLRDLIQENLERDVGRGTLLEGLQSNSAQEYTSNKRIVLTKQNSAGQVAEPSPLHLKRRTSSGYFSA